MTSRFAWLFSFASASQNAGSGKKSAMQNDPSLPFRESDRPAPELRQWFFDTKGGAGKVNDATMKRILDTIEKKDKK
jgi:hypothetical protein